MRTAFINSLCETAETNDRVWLLTGDLGYSVLELFAQRFPKRFVNVGVAEQNMTSVAAGLALEGKIVFTYSIANFPVMRCLEQVRNDICFHNLNVKIVAVGGGVAYGSAGYSHHAVEDLAVMCAMPGMTVLAPGDPVEARLATSAAADWQGPCYLRLGKGGEPVVHKVEPSFTIGKAITIRDGIDVTLVCTGGILSEVISAAEKLAPKIQARVISMATVKPLDVESLLGAVQATKLVVTIEEHSSVGGLGSAVAKIFGTASRPHSCHLLMLSLKDSPMELVSSQKSFRQLSRLDTANITLVVEKYFAGM